MVESEVVSLAVNLVATGITAGTSAATQTAKDEIRRRTHDEDLEDLATEFSSSLKRAIEGEDDVRNTGELTGVTDDWTAVVDELADLSEMGDPTATSSREREQLVLFRTGDDESDVVTKVAEAIAAAQGFDLTKTPQLRESLIDAVAEAYREALIDFQHRIAGTDLSDVFQQELGLHLGEQLEAVRGRLESLTAVSEQLLTQAARNEGFRQLSPVYFERVPVTPETSWRTTFTLADVEAGIPAERTGRQADTAIKELLNVLTVGEDRIVVGKAGAGKSTLCKQVAVEWYRNKETGPVLYRDTDQAQGSFESRDALKAAIDQADGHVLVIVEDVVRSDANAVLRVVEEYESDPEVTFLLDARESDWEEDLHAQAYDESNARRARQIAGKLTRYTLPGITETDVERVIAAFEDATGRDISESPEELYNEVQNEDVEGFGAFMLLVFYLPLSDEAIQVRNNDVATGLEGHVQARFQTLEDPKSDDTLRDLSGFDSNLLSDVGVMVNLLNASGIGIYPELVHALGYEYGHDIDTHDQIAEIRASLEGWFLYPTTGDKQVRSTHPLWSTLYLRALAQDHAERQAGGRRRDRSESQFGRCLESLFRLFDDEDHREALAREFPQSLVLSEIERNSDTTAMEYVDAVLGVGEEWPILAPLYGTTRSAVYDLSFWDDSELYRYIVLTRGNIQRRYDRYTKAKREYNRVLDEYVSDDEYRWRAKCHLNLGRIAWSESENEEAKTRFETALELFETIDDQQGKATTLSHLGIIEQEQSVYGEARKSQQRSLEIYEKLGNIKGVAKCRNNLGIIAWYMGDFGQASEEYQKSLELFREVGDRRWQGRLIGNIGLLAGSQMNFDKAREYIHRSWQIKQRMGDQRRTANTLNNLGLIELRDGNYEKARQHFEDSIQIEEEVNHTRGKAISLLNLGEIAIYENQVEDAIDYLETSLDIFEECDDQLYLAQSRGMLGAVKKLKDDNGAGQRDLETALSTFDNIGATSAELRILRHHINVERQLGHLQRVDELCQIATNCVQEADSHLGYEQRRFESVCGG